MLEDLYSKVDFTKKVRFQTGVEEKNKNISGKTDNAVIYDNYCTEECTQPKLQENASEDQQQAVSVSQGSRKRSLLGAVSVFLGLLCLFFLAAVIVLLVLWILDKSNWNTERTQLWVDNEKLIREKSKLQTINDEIKSFNANLTQKTSLLEEENKSLKGANLNLTNQIYKLQNQIEPPCPANWTKFNKNCYLPFASEKKWTDSKKVCENLGASLMMISSTEEQIFASAFQRRFWIGLTDVEKEGTWKWVNGQKVNTTYWKQTQPDNYNQDEDCVELSDGNSESNWNDMPCDYKLRFICEITN